MSKMHSDWLHPLVNCVTFSAFLKLSVLQFLFWKGSSGVAVSIKENGACQMLSTVPGT